ncbi:MAG: hypothetical protein D6701_11670 [Gemmatimonadetes bacterium]|nr:MAG: hypothetical protein D6701_11670 [Gemmatimonadota bacterium]
MHSRRLVRTCLALLLGTTFALVGANEAAAQGVTTSAISGVVRDQAGQPVSGAQISVLNTETGVQVGSLSNAEGRYFVQHLQPGGPYTVSVEIIGFAPQRREGIVLSLGENRRVDFTLSQQAVELGELRVTAERSPLFTSSRTGQETIITSEEIMELPSLSRNFTELASLSPLVSTAGVGASIGGMNNRFNNIQVDGAVNNDVFGLAASGVPGGQANGKPISQDAIAEFQVLVAPFDVRQAGFTGGLINAVTKGGTNEFHGSLYGFFRNQDLLRKDLEVDGNTFSVADFENSTIGFTLGGPIQRDRIHFFVSGEFEKRDTPLARGVESGGESLGLDPSTITQIQQIAEGQYGLNFGRTNAYTNKNPATNLFGRIDWQISDNHRLSLKHTYADADFDDFPSRSGGGFFEPESATYDFRNETNTSVAQLFSSFGRWSNEALLTVQFIRDQRAPAPEFRYSTIIVDNELDPVNDGARVQFGAERFSHANRLDQDILQFTNNLTADFGRNRWTFGVNYERWAFDNLFLDRSLGQYTFDSIEDFRNGAASDYRIRIPLTGSIESAAAVFAYNKLGFYVQDEYQASDNLTWTFGFRVDVPFTDDVPRENAEFERVFGFPTTQVPSGNPLFQPRIGFNYQTEDDGLRNQIRGGLGIFAGRPPFVWISNAFGNTGRESVELRCRRGNVPAFNPTNPPMQCLDGTGPASGARASIAVVDPDFKFPTEFKADLAWDREWGGGLRTTVEGILTKPIDRIVVEELNGTIPSGESSTGLGIGNRVIYGRAIDSFDDPWEPTLRDDTNFFEVVRMTNSGKGYSYSLIGEVEKDFDRWLNLRASYTYARSFDIQSMTSSRAISNYGFNPIGERVDLDSRPVTPSNFDTPHHVVGVATLNLWEQYGGTNISLIYRGQSGRTYQYVYDGDVNGDGFAGAFSSSRTNDLVYIPESSSELAFRSADDERLFNEMVELDECLREAKGSILERNSCRAPWQDQLDLRVIQGIKAPQGRIEVIVDVFNVLNLLNESWGVQEGPAFNTVQLLRTRGRENDDPNGRILFTYDGFRATDEGGTQRAALPYSVQSTQSRWRVNLGLRYRF